MGFDFLERTTRYFKKAVSQDAEAVARMARTVSSTGHRRTVVADCVTAGSLVAGSAILVRAVGEQLILVDGIHQVGCVPSPPPDVLQAIKELGGYEEGRVEHVNTLGGTADVILS